MKHENECTCPRCRLINVFSELVDLSAHYRNDNADLSDRLAVEAVEIHELSLIAPREEVL